MFQFEMANKNKKIKKTLINNIMVSEKVNNRRNIRVKEKKIFFVLSFYSVLRKQIIK